MCVYVYMFNLRCSCCQGRTVPVALLFSTLMKMLFFVMVVDGRIVFTKAFMVLMKKLAKRPLNGLSIAMLSVCLCTFPHRQMKGGSLVKISSSVHCLSLGMLKFDVSSFLYILLRM